MKFRHEWKHIISFSDFMMIRPKLEAIMERDRHAVEGKYFIRSLYFDDPFDTALREKLDGVSRREKFRIRYYNNDTSQVNLEKKSKINGLCAKKKVRISPYDIERIMTGDVNSPHKEDGKKPLLQELFYKMQTKGLSPKVIVDYTREPFTYAPGNVRVTLDYNIRTGLGNVNFLDTECVTIPIKDDPIILEVKWDEYLPSVIRNIVQLNRRSSAFSKYAVCRMYD